MASKALLVVDMQNGFCHPQGSFAKMGLRPEGVQAAVRNAAVAVERARRAAIPVVFTRHVYRPERPDEGPSLILNSPDLAALNGLAAGYWDAHVVDELGCGPEDLVVDKVLTGYQLAEIATITEGFDFSPPAPSLKVVKTALGALDGP